MKEVTKQRPIGVAKCVQLCLKGDGTFAVSTTNEDQRHYWEVFRGSEDDAKVILSAYRSVGFEQLPSSAECFTD